MTTQDELGERLREARRAVGLSQEAAAAHLGVPRPTISYIEAGKREVGGLELAKLAALYGRSLNWFIKEQQTEHREADPLAVLFRAGVLQPEDHARVAAFAQVCRNYRELETLLDLGEPAAPPEYGGYGPPRSKLEAIRQGDGLAAEERRRLGLGDAPIRDIFTLVEEQGVRLFMRPLAGSDISGLFLYDPSLGPCVLVNSAERRSRLSFSAAHEYSHVLIDRRLVARVSEVTLPRHGLDRTEELLEIRANSFAAAFLLPADGIERFLLNRGRSRHERSALDVLDALAIQRAFGVSYQATLYRLQNLRWLDAARRETLAQHQPEVLARSLGLSDDPESDRGSVQLGQYPLRYIALALEAYRRAKITVVKLAELLDKTVQDTKALVQAAG